MRSLYIRSCLLAAFLLGAIDGCACPTTLGAGSTTVSPGSTTVSASLGGRDVVASSPSPKVIFVRLEQQHAVFNVDGAAITVGQTEISWGTDNKVALPSQWRQMRLICSGKTIDVQLDGKPFSQIQPAA